MSDIDFSKVEAELAKLQRPPEELLTADLSSVRADAVLDVQGEVCPYPVDVALRKLAGMRPGQILKEVTDHTISTHNVPQAVREKGLGEVIGIRESEPGVYELFIRRS